MTIRILIVDDEPAIGKLLTYQLRSLGYQTSYVQDGLLALRQLIREAPDLVLLDVMMPQISGWEVCRQIRACSSTPVIMLTAKSADLDVAAGLNAGADDYVVKPFSMVQLQARIETVLRRAASVPGWHGQLARTPQAPPAFAASANSSRTQRPQPAYEQPFTTSSAPPAIRSAPAPFPDTPAKRRIGEQLRAARRARGLTLHQVERECRIRWEFLQALEQENWTYLPRGEIKRALRDYIHYLGLDPREMAGTSTPGPRAARRFVPLHVMALMAAILALIAVVHMI